MNKKIINEFLDGNFNNEAAAPLIKEWAMKLLKENKDNPVPLKYIRDIIISEVGAEFSSGSYSGAMRDLVAENNGRIINHSRGNYMYVSDAKRHAINRILERTIDQLNEIAFDNVLVLTDEDWDAIKEIPHLISRIKELKLNK